MAEDTLKRINEILKEGIKATGIDINPIDTTKYGYAPEHSSLILEIENLGLLDELTELVGGEEKLGDLIQAIAFKQEEVSPRYLESTPPVNEYGEEFGAKGAYGITTEELLQTEIQDVIKQNLGIDTPTSPVLKGREGLTIPAEKDRMLEIKWADYWNKNGEEWGVQVHSTYTAEVVDGFYQFKADNPDIPDWWFPRDFMDGQQLTQRAFVGWGVTQEDIDNLKEGFEKGIFDKEKDKKLLEVVNDLDGSDKLIKSIDTPTNVVDDAPLTRNHFGVPESEFNKPKKIVEGDFVKATTLEVKGGLHARPTGKLGKIANDSAIELFLKTPDGYAPFTVVNLWSQPGVRANPDINNIEVFIKKGDNANEVIDYFNKNAGVLFNADGFFAGTEAETSFKVLDTPGGSLGAAKLNDSLVFDSWVDNYAKTTTSFVDNLPLSTTVKNQFNNLVQGRARNLATPGGLADAVDVWELGVLGLMISAVAYKEYDEIPTILTNKAVDMFNNMTSFYGIPPIPKEEYDLDYERINKIVETGEKFMPTDIIIKKVGDVAKGAAETGAVTGFGYVPPNLTKTDTMETTQKIQPGVQEEKMFKEAKPKKIKSTGGSGAKIL